MNKENRDKLIALKQSVVSDLHSIDVDSYKLDKADERLNVYIKGCINNPDVHNLYELLAVHRFFVFLDKYEFRIKEVRKFVTILRAFEILRHQKGKTRYKLTPIQLFQFSNILAFYKPGTNKRLIREALLSSRVNSVRQQV